MTSDWRIIDGESYSEPMHHAIDQTLTERLAAGDSPPTLRFWYRDAPAVPLGRFQAYHNEVDDAYVQDHNIDVVRRITGGGAMFVEPGKVITYSVYLPRDAVSADIEASYAELDQWAIDALNGLGLAVEHEPLNDIVHREGKIGGSAQLRKGDAVLHHTTMSYDLDTREMMRVLRFGEEKISDKAVQSAEQRVARIADHVDRSRSEVIAALRSAFESAYGGATGSLTAAELDSARQLADEKFSSAAWNQKL